EYDTQMSSITTTSGFLDLEMELGGGHRSVTHWITGYADMMRIDENKHPHLAYINQRLEGKAVTMYANTDAKGRPIKDTISWHSTIEMLLRAEMEKMTENGLMWATGGYVSGGQGRKKVKVASGLYPQMRNGNYSTYNTISLENLEYRIANLFHNSGIPIDQRRSKVATGQLGINQIAKELYDRLKQVNPYILQGKDIPGGLFYGDVSNAGFVLPRFTKFFSPIAGWVEFVHNPALDNISGVRLTDGLTGQYPDSSGTYMIMDVTDQNST